jgi:uncharacterized protein (DUF1697 family)
VKEPKEAVAQTSTAKKAAARKTAAKSSAAKSSAARKSPAKTAGPTSTPKKKAGPTASTSKKKRAGELVRYAALLRGVMPTNCKMPLLKAAFEKHGFEDVRTVISSGNVLFSAPAASDVEVEEQCEAAMAQHMDRSFLTIVRRVDELKALIEEDPFAAFGLGPEYKPHVTFTKSRERAGKKLDLPMVVDGAHILADRPGEILTAHIPGSGAQFMAVIERTYGKEITTRTVGTVERLTR